MRLGFESDASNADHCVIIAITNDTHAVVHPEAAIGPRVANVSAFVDEYVHEYFTWITNNKIPFYIRKDSLNVERQTLGWEEL